MDHKKLILGLGTDEPDANPFDSSPKSELEAVHDMKVQAVLQGMAAALQKARKFITIRDLMDMQRCQPELEGRAPPVDDIDHGIYLFSISGVLNKRKVNRALIGGDVIIVSAATDREAYQIATDGLRDTVRLAHEVRRKELLGEDIAAENQGIVMESDLNPVH